MSNLLEQWNEHIVKGNLLSRELENFEGIIGAGEEPDSEIAFVEKGIGTTYISVLSADKMAEFKQLVLKAIIDAKVDKTAELEKLMGIRKPAIINQEFEKAVQEMEQSTKAKPVLSNTEDKQKADPVEEKLVDIPQEEAKKIEEKKIIPETPLDKYPAKKDKRVKTPENMTAEVVGRMYRVEMKSMDQIADHFGVKMSTVNNFIYLHGLSRTKTKKQDKPEKQPEETERP